MMDKNGCLEIDFNIPKKDLEIFEKSLLGAGGSGSVCKGRYQGIDVAIKKLRMLQTAEDKEAFEEFRKEASIMAQLRHPNIVVLYGACMELENYYIVMEYMERGSLDKILHSREQIDWSRKLQLALGISRGLTCLHRRNILHRDLKSLNILVNRNWEAKITDFGLSKMNASSVMTSLVYGTLLWTAPEILNTNPHATQEMPYSKGSDIYGFGIILWELLTRKEPFYDIKKNDEIVNFVIQGGRPTMPNDLPSSSFAALMSRCWAQRAAERPRIENVTADLEKMVIPQPIKKEFRALPMPTPR